jgi:formylmethanofuran dehydrogenase subunit E
MDAFRLFTGCTHGREGLVSQRVHGKYLYLIQDKSGITRTDL